MQVNTQATEVALKEASNEVSLFVVNAENEVKALEERFANVVPIAETKEGYDHCKEVRKELQPIKKGLEEARKTLKAPILEAGRLVDSSLNPLAERVGLLITPFVDAYQAVDKEKERKKQARLNAISDAFKAFDDALVNVIGQTSTVIQVAIDELADFDLDPKVFMERTDEAAAKHAETMERLGSLLMQAINAEEMEAKQKALEDREAKIREDEAREQARVDKIAADEAQAKQDAIDKEKQAQREAEMQQAREEAAELAKINAKAAHEEELRQAEVRAKQQAEEATRIERERIEAEQAQEKAEAAKREANRKHKASIHNEILTAFLTTGMNETQAKAAIKLIATGKINPLRISY